MRYGVALALMLFASRVVGQDSVIEESPRFSAEITAELQALSAPEFSARESAARRLLSRKLEAVAPLSHVAANGTVEASVRAFDLLRQIYREGDDETNEAAETAFETLSQSDNPNVASRAEVANEANVEIRRARSIAAFRKLGGIIRFRGEETIEPAAIDESAEDIEYAMLKDTWKGGDEGLKYLRRIPDFRKPGFDRGGIFAIKGSKVSDQAIADLEAAIPNLSIARRGPACFGITASAGLNDSGLIVISVRPGTAAHRAGLQAGDKVLKFDGHEVPDFLTLVDRISEKQPGDKVPVIYVRNDVQDTLTVELRGW